MVVGRYAGKRVDQLPNSYLRWVIMQDFPVDIVEAAKRKLAQSDYNDEYITVSRHAIDMYSKRFLDRWWKPMLVIGIDVGVEDLQAGKVIESDNLVVKDKPRGDMVGLATHIALEAKEAWEQGKDASKHRHAKDGIIRVYEGIQWVFAVSPHFPDYKEVITLMEADSGDETLDKSVKVK